MSDSPPERIVSMRLQKFLARAGVASRRGSENLMTAGRVTVNGKVASELGTKVHPLEDVVALDGVVIVYSQGPVTIMLNKPAGYITTMSDPFNRACVAELVPTKKYPGLFPIGRLDAETTGLLLFTTDGELGNRLMHPRHHVEKTYLATIKGEVCETDLAQLREGIVLDDGLTLPAKLCILSSVKKSTEVEITIREGRNRQVRRMFDAIGHTVIHLHRTSIGALTLGNLATGTWRVLSEEECTSLIDS